MISRFLFSTFLLFLVSVPLEEGQRFSNSVIERNRNRYDNYEQCLRERHDRIEKLRTQPMAAISVRQGASIKLECFQW
jgi:hypothetical protein